MFIKILEKSKDSGISLDPEVTFFLDRFTISQSSKYTTYRMLWVLRYPATTDTIFVKTQGADVGLKHMTFHCEH